MKLLELYEALFQFVCRLNRAARTPNHPDFTHVRSEIKTLFEEINRRAAQDITLLNQVKQLERPLVFFVDNLICTSRLNFAPRWASNRLAGDYNELAGDERFFVDFLDRDMADPSPEAAERLAVYYVCLGLGFTGMYVGQPEKLRDYTERIFPRIRQWMDSDPRTKISEQAYGCTDTRILTEPPGDKILLVVLAFIFLSLTVLVISYGLYFKASGDLKSSVGQIRQEAQTVRP
jgi:type IV/VI secretion system ImpK/VasF family protein